MTSKSIYLFRTSMMINVKLILVPWIPSLRMTRLTDAPNLISLQDVAHRRRNCSKFGQSLLGFTWIAVRKNARQREEETRKLTLVIFTCCQCASVINDFLTLNLLNDSQCRNNLCSKYSKILLTGTGNKWSMFTV